MSGQKYDHRLLPALVQEIKAQSLSGQIVGRNGTRSCQLYFKTGQLIHAFEPQAEISGDDVLYDLINWPTGQLEWHSQPQLDHHIPQTLDEEQASTFYHTLQLLQQQGKFDQKLGGWQLSQNLPQTRTISTPPVQAQLKQSTNWPLLPGAENVHLRQKIDGLDVVALVKELQKRFFSGYITYKISQTNVAEVDSTRALLLFELGQLTTARFRVSDTLLQGQAAYESIANQSLPLEYSIEVEPALVTAYRGMIEGFSPFAGLAATQSNFARVESAFSKQQRSGLIRWRCAGQSEIYYLVNGSLALGSFGASLSQPQLWRSLNLKPEFFWQNSQAQLDVFVTRQAEQIDIEKATLQTSNVQLVVLLNHALQQLFELVCQLSASATAFAELLAIARTGSTQYPALRFLDDLKWEGPNLPDLTQKNLTRQQSRLSQTELLQTYQYLINSFLAKYVEHIGPDTFRELAELALASNKELLIQTGMRLDFLQVGSLDTSNPTWGELIPSRPTWAERETRPTTQESNAFDF